MAVGYTPKQAERLKHKVSVQVARIEDLVNELERMVPDTRIDAYLTIGGADHILEEFRAVEQGLHETVDRRTHG